MTGTVENSEWPGIPEGVQSRTLPVRDLDVHFFEAGKPADPLILLLHGFPEIAYSWRKVILPFSRAGLGYHVVAPDMRGFGRTKPQDPSAPGATRPIAFDDDLTSFKVLNLAEDIAALVSALGHESVSCLVGHDAGATIAGFSVLAHPELYKSVVFVSTPFPGAPAPGGALYPATVLASGLGALDPPRKHYMLNNSTARANDDMWHAPQGLHAFFRGYFHIKSADWAPNDPHPLEKSAAGLGELPHYYVMPRDATMADVAQAGAPSVEEAQRCAWLPDEEVAVYAREYERTGFQGGLNRYRVTVDSGLAEELTQLAGKTIDVPAMYVCGKKDWGLYQNPGAVDRMQEEACTDMEEDEMIMVPGAGHWVQQEQPEAFIGRVSNFLNGTPDAVGRLMSRPGFFEKLEGK